MSASKAYRPKTGERAKLIKVHDSTEREWLGVGTVVGEKHPSAKGYEPACRWCFQRESDGAEQWIGENATWEPVEADVPEEFRHPGGGCGGACYYCERQRIWRAGRASEAAAHAETTKALGKLKDELEAAKAAHADTTGVMDALRKIAQEREKQRDEAEAELAKLTGREEPSDEALAGELQRALVQVGFPAGHEDSLAVARAAKSALLGVRRGSTPVEANKVLDRVEALAELLHREFLRTARRVPTLSAVIQALKAAHLTQTHYANSDEARAKAMLQLFAEQDSTTADETGAESTPAPGGGRVATDGSNGRDGPTKTRAEASGSSTSSAVAGEHTPGFSLESAEREKAEEFMAEHLKRHGRRDGAIGGRFTFSFTPTSIGVIAKITCACGEAIDVTEYDSW